MPVERPGTVTAAGVLCIIYGSLGLICGICGVASLVMQSSGRNPFVGADPVQARLQAEMEAALRREVPGYQAVQISTSIVGLIIPIVLLTSGIGLLGLRPWARTLTLIFVWIGIANYLFQMIWMLALVLPAMSSIFQVILPRLVGGPGGLPPGAIEALRGMMTLISVVMVIVYGVIIAFLATILILLAGSRVRMAFAGIGGGRHDDDDRWREPRPERRDEADDWRRPPPPSEGPDDWRYREGR